MSIRSATPQDQDGIQSVHWSAFGEDEREMVSRLAVNLLAEEGRPQTISLVAEIGGTVVGHVAFSPVALANDKNFQGYILAPLGVKPTYQKHRIGSKLIEHGLEQLSAMGVHVVFVYGDPKFYGRFGFTADAAHQYTPPYNLQYPFGWQAIVLNKYNIEKPPVAITCVTSLFDQKLW